MKTNLINRPAHLQQLLEHRDTDLVKIVTGIRRCGKSSPLDLYHEHLLQECVLPENIIHMNLKPLRYRELKPLQSIKDNYEKIILSMDWSFIQSYEGIRSINLIDWLIA